MNLLLRAASVALLLVVSGAQLLDGLDVSMAGVALRRSAGSSTLRRALSSGS